MTDAALKDTLAVLEAALERKLYRRFEFFEPYPKQQQFFDLGLTKRERLLMAGNQLGKTEAGAYETTLHLTGEYPDDWLGRRFDKPVKWWAAGETSLQVRDVMQKKLCGEPGVVTAHGTGFIPRAAFVDKPSLARGVTDAYDTIQVRHKPSGGISLLRFKSYEQGREKFQGETLDGLWFDEEPDQDIYSEGLTRTAATGGLTYMTFTPLKGVSKVVSRFLHEPSPDRSFVTMTIDDAGHMTPEKKRIAIAGYLPHEREARAKGVPMLGSGRIFTVTEDSLMEPAILNVPIYWTKLWGIDFGIGHPFGAVLIYWDTENDCIHVANCIRVADQLPLQHAAAMKPIGLAVPVAWPQDGTARDKGSGEPLSHQYKKHGLMMLPDHATFPDGSMSTEAGIVEMQERMTTGRLKVANHLSEWFEEFRLYHRKDGLIVKERDDLLSATRVAVMARRHARPVPLGGKKSPRRGEDIARDVDFPLF